MRPLASMAALDLAIQAARTLVQSARRSFEVKHAGGSAPRPRRLAKPIVSKGATPYTHLFSFRT